MITGRDALARFADQRFPNDPALVASLDDRLRRRNRTILHDLTHMPNTWDDRLLGPLLKKYEGNDANWELVLRVLELHGSPQKSNAAIARRLSRAIVASGVFSNSDASSKTPVYKLSHALQKLGRTHDRAALKHVKPFLDDKRHAVFTSVSRFSMARVSSKLPAVRVCDYALEAALMLLDGNASAMYPQFKKDGTRWEATTKRRDELIAQVKKRIGDN